METTFNTVTINGIEYVEKSALERIPTSTSTDVQIIVLQRGWVMVGRFSRDGEDCALDDAAVIRTWGTKKGLGELAAKGPQPSTVLDPTGHVEFHILTVVARIATKGSLWNLV